MDIEKVLALDKALRKLRDAGYDASELNKQVPEVSEARKSILSLLDTEVEQAKKEERIKKDVQWHDNIQMVKVQIQEGANLQYKRDENVEYDNWHPELALLWEIAIEASHHK